jgi:hypothetical protein
MISVFNDYVSENLLESREKIDLNYHWENEDQMIKSERNQMRYNKQWY